ncbi:gluconate kinase [Burkholderia ambifaria]|nr:hypothetical protein [Burkholderia ambifaria]MDR6498299.1 gluconate kinase [Burkholderia ambifaria]
MFLEIDMPAALARVSGRAGHAFQPELVASRFAALESPIGENDVLPLHACAEQKRNVSRIVRWLAGLSNGGDSKRNLPEA